MFLVVTHRIFANLSPVRVSTSMSCWICKSCTAALMHAHRLGAYRFSILPTLSQRRCKTHLDR